MKIDIKKLPGSQIEFKIELLPEELEQYSSLAIQELGKNQKIKGFRPGQASLKVLEGHLGKDQVFNKMVDLAVKKSFVKAVLEHKLEPIGEPKIEILKAAQGNPLIFKAEFSVLPKVEVGDYTNLGVRSGEVSVSKEDIENALATLQKSKASYSNVARAAEIGDRIEIDFKTSVGGSPLEDGTSQQHPLIIGQGHFMKGFENELIGMKEGEEKNFSLIAPENYYRKDLAGKKVDFVVKMSVVQKVELPELNDEFAKKVGKFTSLENLRESINDGLLEEKKQKEKEKTRLKIVDVLIDKTPFDIPDKLVGTELVKMENEFLSSLANMGVDKESYMAHIKKSPEDLKSGWQGQAQKRVKAALILREIAQKEGISVLPEEVEARVNEFLKNITNPQDASKIDVVSFKSYIQGVIRNEKVFEFLEKNLVK